MVPGLFQELSALLRALQHEHVEVRGVVGDALQEGRELHLGALVLVPLADLHETPEIPEPHGRRAPLRGLSEDEKQVERGRDGPATQGIQHHVHSLPIRSL